MDNFDSPFLTIQEHAKPFRLAANTVKNRIISGTWPAKSVKIGKLILIPRCEHQRVIEEMLAAVGIEPVSGNGPDPHLPPCPTPKNPVLDLKRGRGRPRKSIGGKS